MTETLRSLAADLLEFSFEPGNTAVLAELLYRIAQETGGQLRSEAEWDADLTLTRAIGIEQGRIYGKQIIRAVEAANGYYAAKHLGALRQLGALREPEAAAVSSPDEESSD